MASVHEAYGPRLHLSALSPQTYIGTLLVSVNPYKELDMYSQKQMDTYMGVNFFELPPHM